MAGVGEEEGELALQYTPTWIVAGVCSIIVFISLGVERLIHFLGKTLKKKNQKPLFAALQKVKEELMLLGFISLLLVVFQGPIQKICIPRSLTRHMLPCTEEEATAHSISAALGRRRLLSGGGREGSDHCGRKACRVQKYDFYDPLILGRFLVALPLFIATTLTLLTLLPIQYSRSIPGKVPLLSLEALHQLHIFIFVLAVTHVLLSALTMLLSGAKIRQWKHWEDSIQKVNTENAQKKVTHVDQEEFIQEHFMGFQKRTMILSWLLSFVKHFYGSVTKSDYTVMRLGFIMTHCKSNQKFDFYKYMVRALEADFKKVVGISWYLWIFVVVFLLLNVHGWHTYFWMSFIPLILLLVVGTKLEHIISQLAHELAEKNSVIEGDLVVKPSDHHFWFHQPKIIIYLIHFILFENAFELSFFFWILTTYGFDSCIMGRVRYIVPRLVISVIIQLLCSYSTLPLYAIVTQMGSNFKRAIFEEHVEEKIVGWADKVKNRTRRRASNIEEARHEPVELNEIETSS